MVLNKCSKDTFHIVEVSREEAGKKKKRRIVQISQKDYESCAEEFISMLILAEFKLIFSVWFSFLRLEITESMRDRIIE